MIRRLTRRMILLVLSGLLLASAGLVFAINFMNWQNLSRQASDVLDELAVSGGQRLTLLYPRMDMEDFQGLDENSGNPFWEDVFPPESEDGRSEGWPQQQLNDGAMPRWRDGQETDGFFPAWGWDQTDSLFNAVSLSNYYTITLDQDGAVLQWTSDRADIYADGEVKALAAEVMARGDTEGRVDTQFYRLTETEDGYLLIVVDERLEIQNAREVLRLTLLVALAEDALLSLGALWLIRRMVRPVDEAMEKQKQFVWDASHELKTPLAVISANAEVLSADPSDQKPLEYIQSEVRRTDQLIQSLLTLARMEKGGADAEARPFDLSRALMEVALPFESAVYEAGKTIAFDVPEGVQYVGNEEMIKQLAVILLSNAQKYSDDGGSIRLSLEEKGDKRILRVHNTGPAIPPDAQEKIFDRFYRLDSSHNRAIEGNGLGLAIARSIVESHHGRIAVHSAPGEGTTFTVTL